MTRGDDSFIPLENRAAMAKRYNADLLLSIHMDSCPSGYISGPTVYIARNASWQSKKIANSINASLVGAGMKSKGIRRKDFKVLAGHSRPAVLVECGYLTNRNEAKNLNNSWYQKKMSNLITDGVISAIGKE